MVIHWCLITLRYRMPLILVLFWGVVHTQHKHKWQHKKNQVCELMRKGQCKKCYFFWHLCLYVHFTFLDWDKTSQVTRARSKIFFGHVRLHDACIPHVFALAIWTYLVLALFSCVCIACFRTANIRSSFVNVQYVYCNLKLFSFCFKNDMSHKCRFSEDQLKPANK